MEFRQFGLMYILRLDKGEEIIKTVKGFCRAGSIALASVSGIGAVNEVTLGLFETGPKRYVANTLSGDFELTALSGNITTMDGDVYLHLHATVADPQHHTYGGHLSSAFVSATAELIIISAEGSVERAFSREIGLNLLRFS